MFADLRSPGIGNAHCLLFVQITILNQIQTAHLSLTLSDESFKLLSYSRTRCNGREYETGVLIFHPAICW